MNAMEGFTMMNGSWFEFLLESVLALFRPS
jgi:hypothetical protein